MPGNSGSKRSITIKKENQPDLKCRKLQAKTTSPHFKIMTYINMFSKFSSVFKHDRDDVCLYRIGLSKRCCSTYPAAILAAFI